MKWSVTTPPTGTVLTWDQLKHHVRPASINEQPYIMGDLLPSATDYAETMMECCLLPQTITASFDIEDIGWLGDFNYLDSLEGRSRWQLPRGPVISITSVTDAAGNAVAYQSHTAGNADYILPQQTISAAQSPVTVVYQAGFNTIPAAILSAIRVHVATMYMVHEDITNLPANSVHKIDDFYRFKSRGTILS